MNLNILITDEQFITANITSETTVLGYGCELYYEIAFEATNTNLDGMESLDYSDLIDGVDYCETSLCIEASHPQFKAISRRLKTEVSFTFDDGDSVCYPADLMVSYFKVYESEDFRDGEEYEIGHEDVGYIASSQVSSDEEFWKLATGLGIQP